MMRGACAGVVLNPIAPLRSTADKSGFKFFICVTSFRPVQPRRALKNSRRFFAARILMGNSEARRDQAAAANRVH
jgi:hypothetical protein